MASNPRTHNSREPRRLAGADRSLSSDMHLLNWLKGLFMSTNDVPGANAANADVLAAGCWAEHDDGSLLFVKGNEASQVVYELYDVAQSPPVYYQDAMREKAFKDAFSYPPTGKSKEKWTWHDKTPFPWSRVMTTFDKPRPMYADVEETLSAAARVAQSLRLRAQRLQEADVENKTDQVRSKGRSILERFEKALAAFTE